MKSFSQHLESGLVFVPALGIGRYPVPVNQRPYDDSYFHRYQLMADTPMGHALTKSRVALVERHHGDGVVLDAGSLWRRALRHGGMTSIRLVFNG